MKKLLMVMLMVMGCAVHGQWLPVSVNTNTGVYKPSGITFGSGVGTITNASGVLTNISEAFASNGIVYVRFNTNTIADASSWARYPAATNVNANGFQMYNAAAIVCTGRVVIGFGVFNSTNEVPAPTSTNVWYVYATRQNGTNYLMGVDSNNKRTWIGAKP